MLISKFDLYNPGWLEVVFENRNKEYGAYELRQHYAGNMVRAMGFTFFGVALLCGATFFLKNQSTIVADKSTTTVVNLSDLKIIKPPVELPKKLEPPKPLKAQPPAQQVATTKYVQMVVKPDELAQNPPKNANLSGAIGPVDTKGPAVPVNPIPVDAGNGAPATPPDLTIHDVGNLDKMPEPDGGMAGWAKFLNKNLRFPAEAQDAGVGGRVILSFVIEKDGSLTNIIVDKKAGYGFDEEATRVLKLAKAWKPGIQNGQPVRVKYTIPINFQVSE